MHAHHRRRLHRQVQVRSALLEQAEQELVDVQEGAHVRGARLDANALIARRRRRGGSRCGGRGRCRRRCCRGRWSYGQRRRRRRRNRRKRRCAHGRRRDRQAGSLVGGIRHRQAELVGLAHATTRSTSEIVVMPCATLSHPSCRRVRMPSATAASCIVEAPEPRITRFVRFSLSGMTSCRPIRPR